MPYFLLDISRRVWEYAGQMLRILILPMLVDA